MVQKAQRVSPLVQEDHDLFVRLALAVNRLALGGVEQGELAIEREDLLIVHAAQDEMAREQRGVAHLVHRRGDSTHRRHQADHAADLSCGVQRLELGEDRIERHRAMRAVPVADALDLEAHREHGLGDGVDALDLRAQTLLPAEQRAVVVVGVEAQADDPRLGGAARRGRQIEPARQQVARGVPLVALWCLPSLEVEQAGLFLVGVCAPAGKRQRHGEQKRVGRTANHCDHAKKTTSAAVLPTKKWSGVSHRRPRGRRTRSSAGQPQERNHQRGHQRQSMQHVEVRESGRLHDRLAVEDRQRAVRRGCRRHAGVLQRAGDRVEHAGEQVVVAAGVAERRAW